MDAPLVTEQSDLHISQIISSSLLICGIISLQLKFLSLQEVARIIFIRNGKRGDIKLHQAVHDISFSTHSQHFEYTVLRTVIGVLGTPFALRDPDRLFFLTDGVVHITRHASRRLKHLSHSQCTLNDERLVDTHEFLNPRIDKQIISDSYLHRIHSLIYQQNRQKTGVKNNIAMIGNISISRFLIRQGRMI